MDLNNDFEVPVGIEEAWVVLNDVERIAPCLPGAQLQEIEGDEYRGVVKVKVGPITAQYKGKAVFIEQNHAEKRVVIDGQGRDVRGAGNANAIITAELHEVSAERTKVSVNTDLKVTGKVAQFGRGVMADISGKLMGQFADNLEELLEQDAQESAAAPADASAASSAAAGSDDRAKITPADLANAASAAASSVQRTPTTASSADSGGVRKIDAPEVEPVDLLDAAGSPVAKTFAPIAAGLAALLVLRQLFRRRSS